MQKPVAFRASSCVLRSSTERITKKIKMNFGTKVDLSVVLVVLLQHLVSADNEFFNKCPEFNPQNELDIELVRNSPFEFNFSPALTAVTAANFHPASRTMIFRIFFEGNCSPLCSNNSGANYGSGGDCCSERDSLTPVSPANSRRFIDFRPLVRHRDDNALRGPWRLRSGLRFLRHRAN